MKHSVLLAVHHTNLHLKKDLFLFANKAKNALFGGVVSCVIFMQRYLFKIDISGIQSFIFDVPSKGAAKQLKARSVYVQAITYIAEEFFKEAFGSIEIVYNGGGNLFFYAQTEENHLKTAIKTFQQDFLTENLFPIIAYIKANEDFKADMQAIAQKANIAKLQKPLYTQTYTYRPYREDVWKNFSEKLVKKNGYEILKQSQAKDPFSKAGFCFKLSEQQKQFEQKIINKVPLEKDKSIVGFTEIAQQATGDPKLAALKIDVDNLGQLFRDKDRNTYQHNSQALRFFFEEKMYDILKNYINEASIYPVFSGGDDCFLIGAWDKILETAQTIQEEFYRFQQDKNLNLTLSAGVVVVSPKFPMVRLAEEAEHALELAKQYGKNKITIFDEPLTWSELAKAQKIAKTLHKLITQENASRAVLHRIKSSEIGFTRLQEQAQTGKLNFPKVHRLKYYLRNFKDKAQVKETIEEIFKEYEQALLQTFMQKQNALNPMVFPVAARWAELLTKSQKKDNS